MGCFACHAGSKPHYRAPPFSSPGFCTLQQRPPDAKTAMISIDDQPADHHETLCVQVLGQDDMDPTNRPTLDVRDEEVLVIADQESGKPFGYLLDGHLVPELRG